MDSLASTYSVLRHGFGWRAVDDLTLAKAELIENGPFTLCFQVFEGFLHYYDGVYKVIEDLETVHVYDHCVKTIGFGVEKNGQEYFVGVNSWGQWAKDGLFKIDINMLSKSRGDM